MATFEEWGGGVGYNGGSYKYKIEKRTKVFNWYAFLVGWLIWTLLGLIIFKRPAMYMAINAFAGIAITAIGRFIQIKRNKRKEK